MASAGKESGEKRRWPGDQKDPVVEVVALENEIRAVGRSQITPTPLRQDITSGGLTPALYLPKLRSLPMRGAGGCGAKGACMG